jgi:hypothetical protein
MRSMRIMRIIRKWGAGRVRRLAQRWGSAAEAAGLLAFSVTGSGAGSPTALSVPTDGYNYGYQVSFQANNALYGYTSNGLMSLTTLGMQVGTSPASAQLSDGTFESAFQGNDHDLYLYNWSGTKISTTLGMDPGTSPALGALPFGAGWVVAFQGRNNRLCIYTSAGTETDTGLRMKPGTSPAIAVQSDGNWAVAITGNDGRVTIYDVPVHSSQTADAMDTASSPSIAALANGSYQVAFEAKDHSLDVYYTGGSTYRTGLSMDPGTSPSIVSQPDGDWEVAFQTKNNELGIADAAGKSLEIRDRMRAGTSPSATLEPDGSYEMAFEAKNDSLDIYHTGDGSTYYTDLSMDPGTSPSLAITTPTPPAMSPLDSKIVSIAESQVGYWDDPTGSYCNPYSAYWGAGKSCRKGNYSSEEWCADFAAWVWRKAGVSFTYGFSSGDINAGAISFYRWGTAMGTWHSARSGYTPQPGDVAVYGLNTPHDTSADHVAIVIGGTARGPNVVDGDWWLGGNGHVVAATDQTTATGTDRLSGYVSPRPIPGSEENSETKGGLIQRRLLHNKTHIAVRPRERRTISRGDWVTKFKPSEINHRACIVPLGSPRHR